MPGNFPTLHVRNVMCSAECDAYPFSETMNASPSIILTAMNRENRLQMNRLQMIRLSLRNTLLKFKTSGKLPLIPEEIY